MTREDTVVTSAKARIERIVVRRRHDCYARFSWLGPEELPLEKPWWCCTVYLDGNAQLALTAEEYLTVEQALVLCEALNLALDWVAEEKAR